MSPALFPFNPPLKQKYTTKNELYNFFTNQFDLKKKKKKKKTKN